VPVLKFHLQELSFPSQASISGTKLSTRLNQPASVIRWLDTSFTAIWSLLVEVHIRSSIDWRTTFASEAGQYPTTSQPQLALSHAGTSPPFHDACHPQQVTPVTEDRTHLAGTRLTLKSSVWPCGLGTWGLAVWCGLAAAWGLPPMTPPLWPPP